MREQLTDTLVEWIQTQGSLGAIEQKRLDDVVVSGYVKDDPNIFAKWDQAGLLLWAA